jgi:hypothetical protein
MIYNNKKLSFLHRLLSIGIGLVIAACISSACYAKSYDDVVDIMVFPAQMFAGTPGGGGNEDHVSVSYSRIIPSKRVAEDCLAYNKAARKPIHDAQIVNNGDEQNFLNTGAVLGPKTTSLTFSAAGVIDPQSPHFDLDSFILAYKQYKHFRLRFISYSAIKFTGLRTYHDRYLNVALSSAPMNGSTTYTYDINVLNPSFTSLSLPVWQAGPEDVAADQARREQLKHRVLFGIGILIAFSVAFLIGYLAYQYAAKQGSSSAPKRP